MVGINVIITLKSGVLDPQGKAVLVSLKALGFHQVTDVRVGKFIEVSFEDTGPEDALALVNDMCRKLLANPIIEDFRYELKR